MLYRLIAKLPADLQALALLYLPSQRIIAGLLSGALTALLAAIHVVALSPSLAALAAALVSAGAAWLVTPDPDTPRAETQRNIARAKGNVNQEGLDLIARVGVAKVQDRVAEAR